MKSILRIVFAPIFWLLQACNPLGNPVNPEVSNNHYYNNSKTGIIYSSMGNWFELGKTEMVADIESFEVLTPVLGKDKNYVFYEAHPVKNLDIDLQRFYTKKGNFMMYIGFDDNHVYTFKKKLENGEYQGIAEIIDNANPATYVQIDWDWGEDGTSRFFRNQKIDCDYSSFKVLNDYFAKDKNTIFARPNNTFIAAEADVHTFKILENSSHGFDKDFVYWLSFFSGKQQLLKIPYSDTESIAYMNRYFLRIENKIFYDGKPMPSIDGKTFEVLNHYYAKDTNHVYYQNKIIPEADAATFVFENEKGVYDKNGRYRDGKLIKETKTF